MMLNLRLRRKGKEKEVTDQAKNEEKDP